MALAILELDGVAGGAVRFRIDTGSNPYYQLRVGRSKTKRAGTNWVDDVYFETRLASNPKAGSLLDTRTQAALPRNRLDPAHAYVQLVSFKTVAGKSPGLSDVVALGANLLPDPPLDFVEPALTPPRAPMPASAALRSIPYRHGPETLSAPTSLDDVLGGIAKAAVPTVADLLTNHGAAASPVSDTGGSASPAPTTQEADLLSTLASVVRRLTQGSGDTAPSTWTSVGSPDNRFSSGASRQTSRAMVVGVDDAAMLALIGPLLDGVGKAAPAIIGPLAQNAPGILRELNQALPVLINAINQKQMQAKAAHDKLASDAVADVNKRMLIEALLRAQPAAPALGGAAAPPSAADLLQVLRLLQTAAPAADAVPAAAAAPVIPLAVSKSLSGSVASAAVPSRRAMLTFTHAPAIACHGGDRLLYARDHPIEFSLRLDVTDPAPTSAMAKAILKIVLTDAAGKTPPFEKVLKLKDVAVKVPLTVALTSAELAPLPPNRLLAVFAELRWLTGASEAPSMATGTVEIMLIDQCVLKRQGAAVSPEREPRDMRLYRSFWNKLWESPVIDEAGSRRDRAKQVLWALDVNARYTVVLSTEHDDNGIMETRVLRGTADADDISDRTEGRLKGGIELSVRALHRLMPLWPQAPALSPSQLAALDMPSMASANASELIYHLKLNGKAGQRGIVWIVPVFRLFEFTIGRAVGVDATGQVLTMADETVRFPLPVAARVLGVRSEH